MMLRLLFELSQGFLNTRFTFPWGTPDLFKRGLFLKRWFVVSKPEAHVGQTDDDDGHEKGL